jgi:putative cell wall-binding protein
MFRTLGAILLSLVLIAPLGSPAHGFIVTDVNDGTGTVEGTLTWPSGALLVGDDSRVTVELYGDNDTQTPAVSTSLDRYAKGHFRMTDVPAGRYAVKFVPEQSRFVGEWWGDTRRAAERQFVDVVPGGTVTLNAALSTTVQVSGSVSGRELPFGAGGPVDVVATTGDAELDSWLRWRRGDARLPGTYSIALLPGSYDISYTDTSGAHKSLVLKGVMVGDTTFTRDVALTPARSSFTGKLFVRKAEGTVAVEQGIELREYRWFDNASEWREVGSCGGMAGNTFIVDCLVAGRYKFSVTYRGQTTFWGGGNLQTAPEVVLGASETRRGIDVVVDDPADIRGVVAVRLDEGRVIPVDSARVTVLRQSSSGALAEVHGVVQGYGPAGATSGNGEFFGTLPPGTYVFRFWVDSPHYGATYGGGARTIDSAPRVVLERSEVLDFGTVMLPKSSLAVSRVAGADRFATAVKVSQRIIPDSQRAPVVYLTNALNFPDALAAGPAAMRSGGVILPVLTTSLPDVVAAELRRLRPHRVVLAGGAGAISSAVRATVERILPADAKIVRLGGASRYETGDLIVRDAFGVKGSRYAIIATGAAFPDALAAGPAAGHLGAPVILVDGAAALSASTRATIKALGVTDVYIAGGKGAVSSSIESGLKSLLGSSRVKRLSGSDRVFTAIAVNEEIFGTVDDAYLASGSGFADALSGGPLAASKGAPLYLAGANCINYWSLEGVRSHQAARLTLLGGTGVLGSGVAKLKTCG